MLFDLADLSPPRPRLTIEHPQTYAKAIVRCYFTDSAGRRACLDSPLYARSWAIALAHRLAARGLEIEVHGWRFNMIRPADYRVHRTKNLGIHRLNKVAGLRRIENEQWWRALPEFDDET